MGGGSRPREDHIVWRAPEAYVLNAQDVEPRLTAAQPAENLPVKVFVDSESNQAGEVAPRPRRASKRSRSPSEGKMASILRRNASAWRRPSSR